ncbi:MAG: 2-oxo acid dehydrogenase subunit E2 [Clostridiales bacterium]|nr:2-oxo acid dehydrogenase subunit E2 [Clostridiales bacterium]
MAEHILMVALSPTMETGIISSWEKEEGDKVESGDLLCQVETDKATMDYESAQEGTLLKILVKPGEEAAIGSPIGIIGETGEDIADLMSVDTTPMPQDKENGEGVSIDDALDLMAKEIAPGATHGNRILASPLARKMAGIQGLDLSLIRGTGPGGRIVKHDIIEAGHKVRGVSQQPVSRPAIMTSPLEDETILVSQKRKIIAQRLAESKYSAPHYYLRVKAGVDGLMKARKALNATLKEKVSFNAFIIKFVAQALKGYPAINATWQGETILRHGSIDIGLAVAQDDGLITPVVRNCGNKGIVEIDRELKGLIDKALNNQLTPEEYAGATFTISNLGSFGIEEFTAIINPPGSAILAVGSMVREPVVGEDDGIEIHSRMAMTLSCDHRVIDGAVGAAFLKNLKDIIEDPIRVLY